MSTSRRQFLRAALGSTTLLSAGLSVPSFLARSARAFDQSGKPGERILVVVQLSGGNDGLNTVIPYADDGYARNRVALRIAAEQVLKIDDKLGLHPQMQGCHKLQEEGRLAILQGIGYPNPDRSHFRSMDIWHTARPEVEDRRDGWLGRSIDHAARRAGQDVPALHLGPNQLPLALVSRQTPVPSVDSLETFRLRTADGALPREALSKLAEAPRGGASTLLDFLCKSTLSAYASSEQVQQALEDDSSPVEYPGFTLARKLRQVAQLLDAGLSTRLYYVSLDGFDTHANQAEAHAALLNEFSSSLKVFMDDIAQRGHLDRVAVLAFSEFGRRVRENASQGTDHGAAAPVFVAGGQVRGGPLGAHPSLTDLDNEGDLKFHTDFRQVYATLLDQWLGCSSQAVLGEQFDHVPLFKTVLG
ncbi:MAG: DUF1501 domain-containing protein [Pirellulales bacterium]